MKDKLIVVGRYTQKFNIFTGQALPMFDIVQSVPGLEKHVIKRHPECMEYIDHIPEIIQKPDYIGKNPKEENSVELVKVYHHNIQIAVKLDERNGRFFVASLYEITEKKLKNRLYSGRLKEVKY